MPKYVPTIKADKTYNLKLVAVISDKTNVYAYVDEDGDQMLVRNFDDNTRLPFITGKLSLRLNQKTGRTYTVLDVTGVGMPMDYKEISIPESWYEGLVLEGEALKAKLKSCVDDAIEAVEYLANAEEDCDAAVNRKLGGRASKKTRESWYDRAADEASEKCEALLTDDLTVLEQIKKDLSRW